jgi:hypothetical protein
MGGCHGNSTAQFTFQDRAGRMALALLCREEHRTAPAQRLFPPRPQAGTIDPRAGCARSPRALAATSPKAISHMKEFKEWLRENHAISWVALIAFALLVYWLSANTPYRQFAIGLLAGSLTLLALMLLVELIWWIGSRLFEPPRADSNGDAAK